MFLTPSSSRARRVVVVDHVMPLLRAEQHRDHVLPQKLAAVPISALAPASALLLDLAHPDRDLGRAQLRDRDGVRIGSRLWIGCCVMLVSTAVAASPVVGSGLPHTMIPLRDPSR
jgi:hypothetical protein